VTDVLVVGAGLAGLAAARDLHRAGADVVVLEARARPGGRVEQETLEDGRVVQLGGELVGEFHTAYLELAAELGLHMRPSYVAEPGEMTTDLVDGVHVGDGFPWMTDAERADAERLAALAGGLARSVDPADPWSHPDADRLDRISVNAWLREQEALPAAIRARELAHLGVAAGTAEQTSLLSVLRMDALAGGLGTYDLDAWESLTVAEGSATVALRMAAELGERLRLDAVVRRIAIDGRVTVTLEGGERLDAEAVVCAVPAGPLRDIAIEGCRRPGSNPSTASGTPGRASTWSPTERRSGASAGRAASPRARTGSARPGRRARACCRSWSHPNGCCTMSRPPTLCGARSCSRTSSGSTARRPPTRSPS
jgi:monoamine oxidase